LAFRGTDGFERAEVIEQHAGAVDSWLAGQPASPFIRLESQIHTALGLPDVTKVFLAALLSSLLRAQALSARELAQSRQDQKNQASA
jgi:hypothetical protein